MSLGANAALPDKETQEMAETVKKESFSRDGKLYEWVEGRWKVVVNPSRTGWWRYHDHYDRNGYCDNPARGY